MTAKETSCTTSLSWHSNDPPRRLRGQKGFLMKRRKTKTVWAYLDGKKLVDVVQAALDNNMMVDDIKALLVRENPGHEVTFKVE